MHRLYQILADGRTTKDDVSETSDRLYAYAKELLAMRPNEDNFVVRGADFSITITRQAFAPKESMIDATH